MCGISGIYNTSKENPVDKFLLKTLTDEISHRGPDGEGFYINENIGLGHRRLSIIDLNTGDQPMFNNDRTVVIVFNGEIYNYVELKNELIKLGHRFKTSSDTEVIINAYEEWGIECQNKFNGMWAFAIWDDRKKRLFISRDRFGEKPMYYSFTSGSFSFCSELGPLLKIRPRKVRLELLELYLFFTYIPEPNTFYQDIYKLEAGKFLLLENGKIEIQSYWTLPQINEQSLISNEKNIIEEFRYLLNDAVKLRMRSDVPFGAFLSGGLDSSTIVSIMAKQSKYNINTFTIGFNEDSFDESKIANFVADMYNTKHTCGIVAAEEFSFIFDKLYRHFGEPFGDSSAIPTYYVSKFAREKVKMALTGDGGDEILSGYNSYVGLKLNNYIKNIPYLPLHFTLSLLKATSIFFTNSIRYRLNKIQAFLNSSNYSFNERMIRKISYAPYELIKALTKSIQDLITIEDYFDDMMKECLFKEDFYKMMYFDFKSRLTNDFLVKVDRMSMASSLETRIPFLDYRLVKYMYSVRMDIKMPGFDRKHILKKSFASDLPKELFNRPKSGFGVPVREWFKDDKYSGYLNHLKVLDDVLDGSIINKVINENNSSKSDYGNFIWTLLMLSKSIKENFNA